MKVENFLAHHGLTENPFAAEEARLDGVFNRLADSSLHHPDVNKIFGTLDQPSTAVVFGEKGSGKTAIRLTLQRKIDDHNQNVAESSDQRRVLSVAYDDFNPILDRLTRARRTEAATIIKEFRLADHQDAILGHAVTKLVDALLKDSASGANPTMALPEEKLSKLRKRLTRQQRHGPGGTRGFVRSAVVRCAPAPVASAAESAAAGVAVADVVLAESGDHHDRRHPRPGGVVLLFGPQRNLGYAVVAAAGRGAESPPRR